MLIGLFSAWLTLSVSTWQSSILAEIPLENLPKQNYTSKVKLSINQGDQLLEDGRKFYESGNLNQAINSWQQALDILKISKNILGQATALNNLSNARQQLGQLSQAQEAIASSLQLISQLNQTPATLKVKAQALNTQGGLEFAQGQPELAINTWKQATNLYAQIGDQTNQNRSLINQAQALQIMGLYRRALDTLELVNQNLKSTPASPLKIAGLRSLGNTLRLLGDLDQSRQILLQSLSEAQQLKSNLDIAESFLSLGNIARAQRDTSAALDYYQQAAIATSSPTTQIKAKVNQFSLLVETKQQQQALALWSQIAPLLPNLPVNRAAIAAKINLAQNLNKLAYSPSEIANLLAVVVEQAKTLGDQKSQSYALGQLAAIYEQNQQFTEATQLTQQALLLSQSLNAAEITYRWQWQMGRLMKAQGNYPEAINAYTEAVNILKSLRSDLVSINSEVQFSFKESVEPIYRQLVGLLLQPDGEQQPSQERLIQARQLIESLQLAELDNFFQEACLQAQPAQLDTVDPTAAVIYPIILDDRLEVILSLPGHSLQHYSTALPKSEVENTLYQFKQSLSPLSSNRDRLQLSQKVYDWLIRPSLPSLQDKSIKTLVFVLDGSLRNLPMSALHDGQKYLVEQYNIALSPGLELLAPRPLNKSQLKALKAGLSEARQGFSALPAVKDELNDITLQVPGKVLLNQDLTTKNLETQLAAASFPVIHLATHGQFSSQAKDTFILTWDGRINVKDLDQLLKTRGTTDAIPLELLVLSACQTASGDNRATLGLAGVAVRSGARTTLASLWSVKDDSTAALMAQFYRSLAEGLTKAEALRAAQISLLRDRQFEHPLYWSPFVLIGNWL